MNKQVWSGGTFSFRALQNHLDLLIDGLFRVIGLKHYFDVISVDYEASLVVEVCDLLHV